MRRSLAILLAVLCSAAFGDARTDRGDRPPIVRVPADFCTIQAAIDAAPDGATIEISRGIYDAGETGFTISGKRLHLRGKDNPEIRGAAPDRERIRDLRQPRGLLNYRAGGGGSVTGLVLTGGDNAIVGLGTEEPPGALEIAHAQVQGSGRRVIWCCAALTVKESHFAKLAWHGISIPCGYLPLQALFVDGVAIVDSEQAGIYMCDAPGTATCAPGDNIINNASLAFNKGGGILAVHSQVCVKDSDIDFATTAGVLLFGSTARVRQIDINFTKHLVDTVLGDGVLTWPWEGVPSSVTVVDSTIYQADGFGIRNLGGHVALDSTLMYCSPSESAIASEDFDGFTASLQDLGGNLCGCPFANASCHTAVGPGGPQAPPPVGGLE